MQADDELRKLRRLERFFNRRRDNRARAKGIMLLVLLLIGVATWVARLVSGGREELLIPVLGVFIFSDLLVALVLILWPWLPEGAQKFLSVMGGLLAFVVCIAIIMAILSKK
ncbi:MAG TPA: hypothetical protein VEW48_21440 [Thermoanaerobaculia bacterium]|nr:hypothetical protein [Thermoanaerobaculia bacterium]